MKTKEEIKKELLTLVPLYDIRPMREDVESIITFILEYGKEQYNQAIEDMIKHPSIVDEIELLESFKKK